MLLFLIGSYSLQKDAQAQGPFAKQPTPGADSVRWLLRGQTRDLGFKPRAFSIDAAFLATSRFDSAKRFPRLIRSDALSGWLNPNRPDNSRSVAVVQRRHSSAATSRPAAPLR